LAVCRGIVESVGGEITLDTAFKGGARFVIHLPAA
jgi:signal transduction histidine kinase